MQEKRNNMKVPDKIYIAETPNKLIEIWSEEPIEPKPYITEHEYIRKGALIEWAEETYLNEKASLIRKVCYKQLIDKLNSM